MSHPLGEPPALRFEISEAARMLRLSRSTLYERIRAGELQAQHDGGRRFITAAELQRYIAAKDTASGTTAAAEALKASIAAQRTGRIITRTTRLR